MYCYYFKYKSIYFHYLRFLLYDFEQRPLLNEIIESPYLEELVIFVMLKYRVSVAGISWIKNKECYLIYAIDPNSPKTIINNFWFFIEKTFRNFSGMNSLKKKLLFNNKRQKIYFIFNKIKWKYAKKFRISRLECRWMFE